MDYIFSPRSSLWICHSRLLIKISEEFFSEIHGLHSIYNFLFFYIFGGLTHEALLSENTPKFRAWAKEQYACSFGDVDETISIYSLHPAIAIIRI